jgi:hypothetical protein
MDGVTYDDERCREARDLAARGVSTEAPASYALYRFLGKRYRVTYAVSGELPISAARLGFLLDDLPLAARLLTTYRGRAYAAEYLDDERRRFRGSKQGTLRGEATRLVGSASEGRLVYFGFGSSKVGLWRLGGQSLATLSFQPLPVPAGGARTCSAYLHDTPQGGVHADVAYSLSILVTPDTAFFNRLMNLGIFRRIVLGQIREVLEDIDGAARALAKDGATPSRGTWTPEEQERLRHFQTLP